MPDAAVSDQVAALPDQVLADYADVLDLLQVVPWKGQPQHVANPDAPVRRWMFGPAQAGQVGYSILEAQREVHLLHVQYGDERQPTEHRSAHVSRPRRTQAAGIYSLPDLVCSSALRGM